MKRILTIFLIFIASVPLFAQTDGISYQAVIIDPDAKEIPGVDVVGNILPNATIAIRFTIFDANNTEEFTEIQITETDQFGMINLTIGVVEHDDFTLISWDGTAKDLRVEIDFNGTGNEFLDLSRQELLFAPYAYHRNITATGTLMVDGATNLNSELTVEAPTNLNSSLDVNNQNNTNLTGMLNVDGLTDLNNDLNVYGSTDLMDSLSVNLSPSLFDGTITVEDTATFNGPAVFNAPVDFVEITVNGPSYLNGQVTIDADMDTIGDETNYNAYPLMVQGSSQGMAIKVKGSRSGGNNYVSFWDADTDNMWGRIEGQTLGDLHSDPEYEYEKARQITDIVFASGDLVMAGLDIIQATVDLVGASSSSTVCAGLGACVTAPVPSLIVAAAANLVMQIANGVLVAANLALTIADEVMFDKFIEDNIGVTYQSGSGDYAEWLPKAQLTDEFLPGDIVGVKGGFITKSTSGADKLMVVSTRPIVLGNMPQLEEEQNYEKIAFMGQVPVKVLGSVEPGDYIIPSVVGSGFGVGVHPDEMKIADYKKIVGVAWSVAEGGNIKYVNLAVGLNTNDLSNIVLEQEEKLNQLQHKIAETNSVLSELVPGFKEALNEDQYISTHPHEDDYIVKEEDHYKESVYDEGMILTPDADDIIYIEVSREQMLEAIEQAKTAFLGSGKSIEEHPFWKKMEEEPAYKEEILQFMERKFEKAMHTHKNVDKKLSK